MELWQAIEAMHVQQDASLHYTAWMNLPGLRQGAGEPYMGHLNRSSDGRDKIDRVTY